MSNTSRNDAIDALKGLAILGVLVLHAQFNRFDSDTRAVVTAANAWVQWSVPAFFFAAGLLTRTPMYSGALWAFLRARTVRLSIPFIAFTLLYKLLQIPLATLGLVPKWEWGVAGGPQLYFLPFLLAVTILVAVFVVAVRGRKSLLVLGIALMAVPTIILVPDTQTHGPHLSLLGLYASSYLAGVSVAAGCRITSSILVLVASSIMVVWVADNANMIAVVVSPLLYLFLCRFRPAALTRPFLWLGRWSGAIYVWHTPLLMPAVSILAVKVLGGGFAALALTLTATLLGSVLLGWVVRRVAWLWPFRM